jgi:hypothetical protein
LGTLGPTPTPTLTPTPTSIAPSEGADALEPIPGERIRTASGRRSAPQLAAHHEGEEEEEEEEEEEGGESDGQEGAGEDEDGTVADDDGEADEEDEEDEEDLGDDDGGDASEALSPRQVADDGDEEELDMADDDDIVLDETTNNDMLPGSAERADGHEDWASGDGTGEGERKDKEASPSVLKRSPNRPTPRPPCTARSDEQGSEAGSWVLATASGENSMKLDLEEPMLLSESEAMPVPRVVQRVVAGGAQCEAGDKTPLAGSEATLGTLRAGLRASPSSEATTAFALSSIKRRELMGGDSAPGSAVTNIVTEESLGSFDPSTFAAAGADMGKLQGGRSIAVLAAAGTGGAAEVRTGAGLGSGLGVLSSRLAPAAMSEDPEVVEARDRCMKALRHGEFYAPLHDLQCLVSVVGWGQGLRLREDGKLVGCQTPFVLFLLIMCAVFLPLTPGLSPVHGIRSSKTSRRQRRSGGSSTAFCPILTAAIRWKRSCGRRTWAVAA